MKNWRELGEVPDSDDESFDDTDPDQLPEIDIGRPEAAEVIGKPPKHADIWSLPSSLSEHAAPEDRVAREQTAPYLSEPTSPTRAKHGRATPSAKPPDGIENSLLEDDISTNYVRITTPRSTASSPPSLLSRTPTPPESPSLLRHLSSASRAGKAPVDDDDLSRQEPVRFGRSLRPRKPIQQHPYLLENVKYTTFMKSHGVKPVRVFQEPQSTRKPAQEEDSQEQEYQTEESQDASGTGPVGEVEGSPPILFDDDDDELALSPSPPKASSPGQHVLRTSSQQSTVDQTDATSVSDDDELPPLEKLLPVSTKKQRAAKRRGPQLLSSAKRKRSRILPDSSQDSSPRPTFLPPPPSMWDLSSSPPGMQALHELSQVLGDMNGSPGQPRTHTPSSSIRKPTSTADRLGHSTADTPIVIDEDTESERSESSDAGTAASSSRSESDSDVVRQNKRRIRGVLPASWLRLDQRQEKPAARNVRRSPEPSQYRGARRGVALPRQGSPKPSSTVPLLLLDDPEESDGASVQLQDSVEDSVQTAPVPIVIDGDDGGSSMEEDAIDWMLPARKRSGSHNSSRRAKRQKKSRTLAVFRGNPGQLSRQPKITQLPGWSKQVSTSTSTKKDAPRRHRRGPDGSSTKRGSRQRAVTPPLLSILDVVEPDAPRFVKIAARAVKRKANLGKTSPSKKLISLATRIDNVDALSALRDWKSGKTRPRVAVPPSRQPEKSMARPALREITENAAPIPVQNRPSAASSFPRKLERQSNLNRFVTVDNGDDSRALQLPPPPAHQPRKPVQNRNLVPRPAQLEAEEREDRRRQLNSRKRTLDAFYRRTRRTLDASLYEGWEQPPLDVNFPVQELGSHESNPVGDVEVRRGTTTTKTSDTRSRFRKRHRPQYLDTAAPQYSRANDPLPADFSVAEVQEGQSRDKLRGLGPYGTHYTQHFEVFPLDRGTFFHESTVIGRGSVRHAGDTGLATSIRRSQRPAVSFSFDGKILRWGPWGDTTSSEFGMLVDWVVEQLGMDEIGGSSAGRRAIEAADFVLGYVLASLSVQNDLEERAFVSRCLEVFLSFTGRFESLDWTAVSESGKKMQLEVAVRFIVAILAVRSIAHASGGDLAQTMKVEDLLKNLASIMTERLLQAGTEDLRILYGELQRSSFRERGIRSDQILANCWVVMMRVLKSAAIPRSSFWDITHSVVLSRGVGPDSDVQTFEGLWQDMFTLLPLCEIDDSGILIPGLRSTDPMEGWALPQRLLKIVFDLYRSNPRQSPGFNDYCRALVARCHFLVQQWGWRKSTGVIGTIFDFFGSQNLAHLRNEEVYKSPRFLEELDGNPSLSIDPEDRCFHIFIKLLALAIQRLKQSESHNDIKNLVARTLPNHNRQYLKEDTVHQNDLAALRNHHDLLCTLFWVSPPDIRPAVHLIEKLVVPGSAHKEACLINVRAWNQLARFVISDGEDVAVFKPFAAWRNNVFNQVLDQYLSAASDIEEQFRALSGNEMLGISKDVRDEMIAKNKATALDLLHFSAKASLDVLRRAPTLKAALAALNTSQLQKVFTDLDFHSPGFDWSILRVALDTLEHFLGRIEDASEEQYSSGPSENVDSRHVEEAVLLLNEHLTKDLFSMSRTLISFPLDKFQGQRVQRAACVEKTVTLAARIAARFIKNRVTQLSPYFSSGKYGLFPDLPKNLSGPERRYLPLFVAVLAKNHHFDFKDIGMNLMGLWILSITKPVRFLGYENYLAEILKQHGLPFLDKATVAVGIPPDYNSNVDFFAGAIHYMRRALRERGPSAQSRQQRDEFCKILQLAMDKMKEDLSLLRPQAAEHEPYMDFVRQVISLIKSHGVGICVVDPFFTQPSVDYSPPMQDPQLQAAGIVAYGVRLGERDVTAVPQLFHYLYNNFKIALGHGRLEQERRILGAAMRESAQVASFALQFMIPAAVQASAQTADCWPLLEVYAAALGDALLGAACVPRELAGEDVEHAVGVIGAVLAWVSDSLCDGGGGGGSVLLSLPQLHVLTLLASVADVLRPSLASHLLNEVSSSPEVVPVLEEAVGRLAAIFARIRSRLEEWVCSGRLEGDEQQPAADETAGVVRVEDLLGSPPLLSDTITPGSDSRWMGGLAAGRNARVQDFARTIVSDVQRNWVVSGDCVMVKMAGAAGGRAAGVGVGVGGGRGGVPSMTQGAAGSSAQVAQGTGYVPWQKREVLRMLWAVVSKWELGVDDDADTGVLNGSSARVRGKRLALEEELLF